MGLSKQAVNVSHGSTSYSRGRFDYDISVLLARKYSSHLLWPNSTDIAHLLRNLISKRQQFYLRRSKIPRHLRDHFRLDRSLFTGQRFVILGAWFRGAAHYL